MKIRISKIRDLSTEKISQRVLYGLIGLTVLIFALFFLVGYDLPYIDDPSFNAPLLTDVLLGFMVVLVIVAIAVAVLAVVRAVKKSGRSESMVNNISVKKITVAVLILLAVLLLGTFLLGSSQSLLINGKDFTDTLWLKVADMFVNTSLILIVVAAVAVIYGATRYYRKAEK